jgi:putative endonuclease
MKDMWVYFMANQNNKVLYTGVSNSLERRVGEHKAGIKDGFTKKYRCHKLVYYEKFNNPTEAIRREKQIKAGSRKKKNDLVNKMNPEWRDLAEDW